MKPMMPTMFSRISLSLMLLGLLAACSNNAEIKYAYIDPTVKNKDLHGVLVIGVAREQASRVRFETRFAKSLERKGVRALASHTLVPGDDLSKEQAIAIANENKLDTILLTRYVGESAQEIYHPGTIYYGVAPVYGGGYNRRFGSYYGHAYEVAYEAPVTTTNVTITLVSDLYEVKTEEHLWQAVSDAIKAGSQNDLLDAFIRSFVNNMVEQKLLD
jgi:hypothetical protein